MSFNPGGGAISGATDVALSNPLNAQTLTYDGSVAKWRNIGVTVTTLAFASTIASNWNNGKIQRVTLTGNATLGNPTNATDGQVVMYQIRQDGTGNRTLNFAAGGSKFRMSTAIPAVVLSTGAGKLDRITVQYHAPDDTFDIIAFLPGA